MNIEQIAKRISNPNLCTSEDIDALRDLTVKYPYAQSFSILYLKALSSNNDIRFDEELLKHAYKITDKGRIYELIQNKKSKDKLPKEDAETSTVKKEDENESHAIIKEYTNEKDSEEKTVSTSEQLPLESEKDISNEISKEDTKEVKDISEPTQEILPKEDIEEKSIVQEIKEEIETTPLVDESDDSKNRTIEEVTNEKNIEEGLTHSDELKTIEETEGENKQNIQQEEVTHSLKDNEESNSNEFSEEPKEEETLISNPEKEQNNSTESTPKVEEKLDKTIEVDPLEKEVILHAVSSNYILEDQIREEKNNDELRLEEEKLIEKEEEIENEKVVDQNSHDLNLEQEDESSDNSPSKKIAFSSWLKANKSTIEEKVENTTIKDESKKTEDIVNNFLTNQPTITKPLKNEENTLPLAKTAQKIALLGPLLNDGTQKAFESVTGSQVRYVTDKGFELTDGNKGVPAVLPTDEKALERLTNLAKEADVTILFLGGDEFTAKEAYFNNALGDRATIEPVGPQDELVKRIKALGKPVIIVLKHRRTLAINVMAEQADAILDAWDLSEMGDTAMARVVFGEVSPSGKLPVTVPRSIGQLPFHYSMKEINNKKGYLFLEDGPLYPFGFGLSYSPFSYEDITLSSTEITPSSEITVSVKVTNTGKMKAKEVVQLYVKDEIGSVTRPDKELKGFEKITLNPGESKTVSFTITQKMLEFTGLTMEKILEAGDYTVMVGTSSKEGLTARFRLEK